MVTPWIIEMLSQPDLLDGVVRNRRDDWNDVHQGDWKTNDRAAECTVVEFYRTLTQKRERPFG